MDFFNQSSQYHRLATIHYQSLDTSPDYFQGNFPFGRGKDYSVNPQFELNQVLQQYFHIILQTSSQYSQVICILSLQGEYQRQIQTLRKLIQQSSLFWLIFPTDSCLICQIKTSKQIHFYTQEQSLCFIHALLFSFAQAWLISLPKVESICFFGSILNYLRIYQYQSQQISLSLQSYSSLRNLFQYFICYQYLVMMKIDPFEELCQVSHSSPIICSSEYSMQLIFDTLTLLQKFVYQSFDFFQLSRASYLSYLEPQQHFRYFQCQLVHSWTHQLQTCSLTNERRVMFNSALIYKKSLSPLSSCPRGCSSY